MNARQSGRGRRRPVRQASPSQHQVGRSVAARLDRTPDRRSGGLRLPACDAAKSELALVGSRRIRRPDSSDRRAKSPSVFTSATRVPYRDPYAATSPPTSEAHTSSTAQQVPGLKRIDLQEHDLSLPGRVVVQNRVEFSSEAPAFRHPHPSEEISYVLKGSLEYSIDGQAPATYNVGDPLMVPPETVHAVKNIGTGNAAELATYIVEKGKPFLVVID
jgi:quercetin dioxygenase-like cupin family protein